MLHLIPAPLHRLGLRAAHRLRMIWRRVTRARRAGVTLIARDEAGRLLLVRHSYGSRRWTLPGGGLARGEEPAAAARRELREELGCEAERLDFVAALDERLWGAPHTAYVFSLLLKGVPRADGREVVEARFFSPDALPAELGPLTRRRLAPWRDPRSA